MVLNQASGSCQVESIPWDFSQSDKLEPWRMFGVGVRRPRVLKRLEGEWMT